MTKDNIAAKARELVGHSARKDRDCTDDCKGLVTLGELLAFGQSIADEARADERDRIGAENPWMCDEHRKTMCNECMIKMERQSMSLEKAESELARAVTALKHLWSECRRTDLTRNTFTEVDLLLAQQEATK